MTNSHHLTNWISNWCNFKQSDYVKNFSGRFYVEEKIHWHLSCNLQLSCPALNQTFAGRTLAPCAITAPSFFVRTLSSLMHSTVLGSTAGNASSGFPFWGSCRATRKGQLPLGTGVDQWGRYHWVLFSQGVASIEWWLLAWSQNMVVC